MPEEIEAKAKIQDVKLILGKLKLIKAKRKAILKQEDYWFGDPFVGYRFRIENGKYFFAFKSKSHGIGWQEKETSNLKEAIPILKSTGIKKSPSNFLGIKDILMSELKHAITLKKEREHWELDDISIELDKNVIGFTRGKHIKLGTWLEVSAKTEEEVYRTFELLEIKRENLVDKSYTRLAYEKAGIKF